jgi:hypothetical protein
MAFPLQSDDVFDIAGQFLGGNDPNYSDGFRASNVPSASGLGTRQGRLPNQRTAAFNRKLMHWLVPEGPIIQMYINPQQVRYNYSKNIENQRTKGGFVIQYWGEALTTLDISGTTGTSGIEGINVLLDIYRNEQLAFDPYALFLAAKQNQDTYAGDVFGIGSALSSGENFLDALAGASQEAFPQTTKPAPTLASIASQVELYWSGEVWRGYFNSFSVTESAQNIGMFDYEISFTVTQKRGFRRNFFAWHRSAVSGPSNSDPVVGTPHSFSNLTGAEPNPVARQQQESLINQFESTAKDIAKGFEDLFDF